MGTIQDIGAKTSPEHKAEAKKYPGYKKATPDLFEVWLVDFFVPRGLTYRWLGLTVTRSKIMSSTSPLRYWLRSINL